MGYEIEVTETERQAVEAKKSADAAFLALSKARMALLLGQLDEAGVAAALEANRRAQAEWKRLSDLATRPLAAALSKIERDARKGVAGPDAQAAHESMVARYADRLAACALIRRRFAGRADLERRAQVDPIALVELETALGLPTPGMAWARAEAWRRAHPTMPEGLADGHYGPLESGALYLRRHGHIRATIQHQRAADRQTSDALLARQPGHYLAEQTRRRAMAAIAEAGFRVAKHSHSTRFEMVSIDHVRVRSVSGSMSASAAGLPRAYSQKAYRVATSEHVWYVCPEYPPCCVGGAVYLSERVRVRQGRGTGLVTEVLVRGSRGLRWEVR